MNRRELVKYGVFSSLVAVFAKSFLPMAQADKPKLTDKDVLKDGEITTIANYCTNPEKQPNKACPSYKPPGRCETCNFFNKDNSLTDYKGGKVARCMLLTDPKKAQFVSAKAWCSTFVAKT